jgi:hypothetical protein
MSKYVPLWVDYHQWQGSSVAARCVMDAFVFRLLKLNLISMASYAHATRYIYHR